MLPDSKMNELGSSNQEVSPSTDKNTRVILIPCCAWKYDPTAISSGGDFPSSWGVSCYDRCVLSEGQKNTSWIGIS